MAKHTAIVISGKLERNPYGDWSDVDKGLYVGSEDIDHILMDYEGKDVRITIEEIREIL